MITFDRYHLDNGLTLLVHSDYSTPMGTICLHYAVGTKDEDPNKTGFAHLFEHLMFGGSKNAANFDDFVQRAGGENNAFTNQDMTVYYDILPIENLDTALWLEADRMQNLILNQRALDIQRKVVVEEFKETCIDEPYGDIWHHLGPLAYTHHPYRVPTIGMDFQHIEKAALTDVEAFFNNYYCPNNAVLTIAGAIDGTTALEKVKKWFGDINRGPVLRRSIDQEPPQTQTRRLTIEAEVSAPAIYMAFPAAKRMSKEFYLDDVISDILGDGEASMLFKKLVKGAEIFSEADAYITATIDQGLFIVEGKLTEKTSMEAAEAAIWQLLEQLAEAVLNEQALERLQNRIEHNLAFAESTSFNKALSLGYYQLLGDAEEINKEALYYQNIEVEDLSNRVQALFNKNKANIIYYHSKA